ncbi:MAG: hypothetical protein M1484_04610 [Patescibacteria group bacterium]|nr:hypothetical protein [Patescibacteria group bacterium]MCL5432338.1 hypothetical protein [Patescibacteria group bacterium]
MITVLHGEDITASRKELNRLREEFDGEVLINPTELAQALEGGSLFAQKKLIILENPKEVPETQSDLIIWFDRKLTAAQAAKFKNAKTLEFKLNQLVFKFVESLRPANQKEMLTLFSQYLDQEVPEIAFSMIVRQFRLMLNPVGLAAWQEGKIKTQAAKFGPARLKSLYKKLLEIDFAVKTGQFPGSLRLALELFLLAL